MKAESIEPLGALSNKTTVTGDVGIGTRKEGFFFLRHGVDYHYKSVRRIGPFVLIRSLGYKLEIRYKSDRPEGHCCSSADTHKSQALERRRSHTTGPGRFFYAWRA